MEPERRGAGKEWSRKRVEPERSGAGKEEGKKLEIPASKIFSGTSFPEIINGNFQLSPTSEAGFPGFFRDVVGLSLQAARSGLLTATGRTAHTMKRAGFSLFSGFL
ncbi:MAG: hypothetical protein PHV51_00710 [Methanosarcinaceae archaeon]|nr:hypothetical protein [Methanosarcinaceae archaeon]